MMWVGDLPFIFDQLFLSSRDPEKPILAHSYYVAGAEPAVVESRHCLVPIPFVTPMKEM